MISMAQKIRKALLWGLPTLIVATLLLVVNHHSDPLLRDLRADRIEMFKAKRTLELWNGSQMLKQYTVSLGHNPLGPKTQEGDSRTPEGTYRIDYRNPESRFHLALHISYPDSLAIQRAKTLHISPGGMIMLHGLRNGLGWIGKLHRLADWTDGCIAVTNPEIEEIYRAIPDGAVINIHP
jgi:murein L,D-transpeptidase YafK